MNNLADNWIIYKDEYLVAVNKPSGMIVHRGWDNDAVTVADIVRDKIVGAPVHAVHRLDRGTSGVLIFALDAETTRFLQKQFTSDKICKKYIALVRGPMREPCVLDHAIPNRNDGERVPAITKFRPLAHLHRWTLLEAIPLTGRLHQIRRHLKHLGHPVVGDVRYGKGDVNRFFRNHFNLSRMALHCYEIVVETPGNKRISLLARVPSDLSEPLIMMGIWPSVQNVAQSVSNSDL